MRSLATLALAAALAAPVAAAAQAPKLGYVDLQRAINETDEGKAARASLKKDFEEKQKQLDARRDDFEKAQQEFEKQAVVMSDQAKRDKAGELERKARELAALFQQLQADLSKREGEAMRGIVDGMAGIVREIAEADGFTMVFEKNDAGLMYGALTGSPVSNCSSLPAEQDAFHRSTVACTSLSVVYSLASASKRASGTGTTPTFGSMVQNG